MQLCMDAICAPMSRLHGHQNLRAMNSRRGSQYEKPLGHQNSKPPFGLQRSLDEFVIEGITTTIDLHKKILNHNKFVNSDFDVNWLMKENFY